MSSKPSVSIVIPVYRSEMLLDGLVSNLDKVLSIHCPLSEIILINDGSPDGSWNTIVELCKQYPRLHAINLMKNYGQHNAILAGIEESKGDVIVTMDDDMQTPPEEIPRMLAELALGYDLVYGIREKEQHGIIRNFFSVFIKWLLNSMLGIRVATSITSFRAFRSELRRAFEGRTGSCVFIDAMLCWGTAKVGSVVVTHRERKIGESGYSINKLLVHTINLITSFSHVPLQLASLVGLGATVIGTMFFIYVLISYLLVGRSVPGFTFIAATLTFFSGIQLFVLGIIGEYLARMHQKMMGAPAYVVRERSVSLVTNHN